MRQNSCQFIKVLDENGKVQQLAILYKGQVLAQGVEAEMKALSQRLRTGSGTFAIKLVLHKAKRPHPYNKHPY